MSILIAGIIVILLGAYDLFCARKIYKNDDQFIMDHSTSRMHTKLYGYKAARMLHTILGIWEIFLGISIIFVFIYSKM